MASERIKVAVVGAGGYAGAELCALLAGHARAQIVGLYASARREKGDQPGRMADLFPRLRGVAGVGELEVVPANVGSIAASGARAVFLATPHEASVELAPALLERGIKVLDLSAAFRLRDPEAYPRHYGFTHARADWLPRAVYGLVELNRARLGGAELVAVPGCYPTSAIVPLRPLVEAGAIRRDARVIIDSTSGVSGAGRGLNLKSLFCEVSLQPYGVFAHRHRPEIAEHTGLEREGAGRLTGVVFTPHLGKFERGILSTIHAELGAGWDEARVRGVLGERYGRERFVRLLAAGQWPAVADVERTNFCDIGLAVEGEHLIIVSAIDNLTKGAAGQAVQCFNVMFGFPEAMGFAAGATADGGAA